MDRIGRQNFLGISSNSTRNTRLACELVVQECPWIVVLPDTCHLLNNTTKDISKIPFFSEVCLTTTGSGCLSQSNKITQTISHLHSIIKYFRKSSFAKQHLTVFRIHVDVKRGLVSVRDTRFLTFYHSGSSVERCLLPIKELVERKILMLTSVSGIFTLPMMCSLLTQKVGIYWMRKHDEVLTFKNGLRQLVRILEPLTRACQCLESSKATAGDIYHFWLAVLATYEQLIQNNNDVDGLQIPDEVINEIHKVVDARWRELTTGPRKSVYVSTFFLDPHGFYYC